jgi:hypothetical protein
MKVGRGCEVKNVRVAVTVAAFAAVVLAFANTRWILVATALAMVAIILQGEK